MSVLLLGAGRGQLAAYRAARELGLTVVGVDPNPAAPGLAMAQHRYSFDLADQQRALEVAQRHRVQGVFTMAADYPMPTLAALCAALALPGPSVDAVRNATHKARMREAFARHGVPGPRCLPAHNAAEAIACARELGGDVVLKPMLSQGGRGISRVPAGADVERLRLAYAHAQAHTRADGVLVEDCVDGPEFSVETLTWQGQSRVLAITDKLTSGAPHFVELGHQQPSSLDTQAQGRLAATALAAIRALGIDQAAGHHEMRLGAAGPMMMESGARLGGGFITSDLVPLSTGIDLVRAALQVAMGQSPDLRPQRASSAAVVRFMTAAPGRVLAIEGLAEARGQAGLQCLDLYRQPGDLVPPLTDAAARCGHLICCAASPVEAAAAADAALARLQITTQEGAHD